jgi:hypothetical protein
MKRAASARGAGTGRLSAVWKVIAAGMPPVRRFFERIDVGQQQVIPIILKDGEEARCLSELFPYLAGTMAGMNMRRIHSLSIMDLFSIYTAACLYL